MWWLWLIGGLVAWTVIGLVVGVVLGRGVTLADRRTQLSPPTTADLAGAPAPAAARTRRRAIPLPTFAVALAAVALVLEGTGYAVRLAGVRGPMGDILSMDAPFSLPRMYVAALFAAAGLVALAAAGRLPERRTWWMAVGLVGAGIAGVKAGSTFHATAFAELDAIAGTSGAIAVSGIVAAAVVGALWFLSRTERRDRRRVLGALSVYALASVGFSAVSVLLADALGGASRLVVAAVFLEEAGEAIGGVVFLVAVLAGVAARLVLPAEWALRRTADASAREAVDLWSRPGTTRDVTS
ncbi:UNVERIFIED_ORG: hypothetical protein E4P37_19680 [Bacillus sp. AZ43]